MGQVDFVVGLDSGCGDYERLWATTSLRGLAGGFLVGVFSVIAGGCVMRQHVLCAQGDRNALFYLVGFYGAVVVYYALLSRFFAWVYS